VLKYEQLRWTEVSIKMPKDEKTMGIRGKQRQESEEVCLVLLIAALVLRMLK